MRVLEVRTADIHVDKRARKDMGNLDELAASIKEKGVIQPIVLDSKMNLLAGERRFRAAGMAGLVSIPAVIRKGDDPIDALEIELIENAHRKDFTWVERAQLEKRIFDMKAAKDPHWSQRKQAAALEQSTGATSRRIQIAEAMELLPELALADNEDTAWKELKKLEENFVAEELVKKLPAEVKKAAQWAKDHYKIGDALETMPKSQAGIADFAEVDPPYGVEINSDRKARVKDKDASARYTEVPADGYLDFYRAVGTEVFRLLKPNTFAVFWYGMTWHAGVLQVLRDVGFGVPDIPAIWTKGGSGQTASPDTTWGSTYEPFFLARKGQPKLAKVGRGNDFRFDPVPPNKKIHLTEKPIELLEEIIATVCLPGSAILIPFLGSGVTLRAAYKLGHTGWGYDLDQRNKDLFLRRVQMDIAKEQEAA